MIYRFRHSVFGGSGKPCARSAVRKCSLEIFASPPAPQPDTFPRQKKAKSKPATGCAAQCRISVPIVVASSLWLDPIRPQAERYTSSSAICHDPKSLHFARLFRFDRWRVKELTWNTPFLT
jgi:hypothetical protein